MQVPEVLPLKITEVPNDQETTYESKHQKSEKNNYNEQCTQYLLWLFEFKMVFDKLNNAFVHLNVAFRSYDIIS